MTPVDDLAGWLTQVWDEQEKAARDRWTWNPLAPPMDVQYGASIDADMVTLSAPGSSLTRTMTPEEYQRTYLVPAPDEQALARIAADRQILARCMKVLSLPASAWEYSDAPDLAEATIRDLAQPYADREGFREEWRA